MNKKTAKKLIDKTKQDYNKIADHFTSTRKKVIWPDVLKSLEMLELKRDKKILDVGAGSGRLYPIFEEKCLDYTGIDLSEELVKNAKNEFPRADFIVGDATNLPFADNTFDFVVSVAALYHIPSTELRIQALREIHRVTKPGGKVYISVWYFWNNIDEIKRIFREGIKIALGQSDLDFGDFYRPWKAPDGKTTTERYCHAWSIIGLKSALKKIGLDDLQIMRIPGSKLRNINFIGKK